MEMMAPQDANPDTHLLGQMFAHDMLDGEIFRMVYGIGAQRPFAAYAKSGKLPDQVRNFCLAFLAEKQPHIVDTIAHTSLPV